MYIFFGALFSGFAVFTYTERGYINWFTGVMGIGFIIMGIISYVRNKKGSMRFPVVATRCRGMILGTELWKADGVSLLVDC